ncbi:hypothetical protein SLEP1_g9324 [Rubroshorea leprosula]|uniref:Uncharacterized protein n=1 Tax=Rubroshorea leprosula TaxID=152421 RepID=A0AAV5IDS3_9ROSI|nr:hypothetical protein SLEP1_g9324 [Rubroshorea leprosula]
MLEQLGSPAAHAYWSRLVLPPPMTLWDLSVSSDDPSGFVGFWELVGCPNLATASLDPYRGVVEILHHPLPSRLNDVS